MIGDSNDDTNFLHKLWLTDMQVSRLREAFVHGSPANIKFSKTQLSMIKLEGFLLPILQYVMENSAVAVKVVLKKRDNIFLALIKF